MLGDIDHEALIVGGGFSGIGAAIALRKAGVRNLLLVETGADFGGTWHWNRYPGIAVDIPSFSYQYSFAQRSNWSRSYAPGSELREYARSVAREHNLYELARFDTTLASAAFDDDARVWRVRTETGDELVSKYFIDATGVLTKPKAPDIPGLAHFAGTTVHTARWNPACDLKGKRVAVIGTGASAVQLIPAVVEQTKHMTVFQRTPIWCLPKYDKPLSGRLRHVMRFAIGRKVLRLLSQAYVEATFVIPAHWHKPIDFTGAAEGQARKWLKSQVQDPEIRKKLTPTYAMGCKRPSFHNSYLATFNRDDVTLETDPIARIVPGGIETLSGTLHEIDVLVLATGFAVFDPGNFPKFPVTGRDGADLETYWGTNRSRTYEGVSVPGFPNWFTVFGPYGYNGSSYFNLVETQTGHIARAIRHARSKGASTIEVRPEAVERYFNRNLKRRPRQIFWQPSCGQANSYYFNKDGDVPLRPSLTVETMVRARTFPLDDYRLEHAAANGTGAVRAAEVPA